MTKLVAEDRVKLNLKESKCLGLVNDVFEDRAEVMRENNRVQHINVKCLVKA